MQVLNRKLFRRYKVGYEVWDEDHVMGPLSAEVISDPNGDAQELADHINGHHGAPEIVHMRVAYTPDGHYIGRPKIAHLLCKKRGIKPEKSNPDHNVCSIGFSASDQKWYGWSHRAIYGFSIGDTVKEGDCTAVSGWTDEYLAEHPEEDLSLPVGFTAESLDDAKRMAIAFAESVG